jgi:hypothetical protein
VRQTVRETNTKPRRPDLAGLSVGTCEMITISTPHRAACGRQRRWSRIPRVYWTFGPRQAVVTTGAADPTAFLSTEMQLGPCGNRAAPALAVRPGDSSGTCEHNGDERKWCKDWTLRAPLQRKPGRRPRASSAGRSAEAIRASDVESIIVGKVGIRPVGTFCLLPAKTGVCNVFTSVRAVARSGRGYHHGKDRPGTRSDGALAAHVPRLGA